MIPNNKQWAFSQSDEVFYSYAESREEAIKLGTIEYGGESFFVGRCAEPIQPENIFSVDQWLEQVDENEDYMGEHAEDWEQSTYLQRRELEDEVRKVMAEWLDRHNLRPEFFNIDMVEEITP